MILINLNLSFELNLSLNLERIPGLGQQVAAIYAARIQLQKLKEGEAVAQLCCSIFNSVFIQVCGCVSD